MLRIVVFLAYSSLFKVAIMATWPQENLKCIVARNCSLELKRDTWDEYLRGRQLNKVSQGTGNENLALSRSVESQALSEISSHPSDSISSLEGDGLQVSFISHSAAAEFWCNFSNQRMMSTQVHMSTELLSCVESLELLNADHLREQIVDLISTRTHELSAQQVEQEM
ncbi:hypothetical protein P5673_017826 [Acropora cervicornis]|uniref:Uncharacterized protein n=1 Tax=Acropora cervicornis TaxID=6130 RepID=A0AAD9QF47_ACRCE|nr:hypothetical protein P5673_017826 [Acropora cervicornis]